MTEPPRRRQALTHVGGPTETEGCTADTAPLVAALDVPPSTGDERDPTRSHVHGFHTYPARIHPLTASRLIRSFVPPGGRVLDPFCGSGTVLVEAMIHNRQPYGTDLNPLAVMLSRCKTRPRTAKETNELLELARHCATVADARRRAKAGATRRYPPDDVALFQPHVLLELDSLRGEIERLMDHPLRTDLMLVLSSILVKLSQRRSDTSAVRTERRIAAGYTAKLFVQRTEDLAVRCGAFANRLSTPLPAAPFIGLDNATELRSLPKVRIDAIITSPPYAATYDYRDHHSIRTRWLRLDTTTLDRFEFGARSRYQRLDPHTARHHWEAELIGFFRSAARVLPPHAPLVLILADSAVGNLALRADEIVATAGRQTGFTPLARASQTRPHFHAPSAAVFRNRPRFEHALLLRRTSGEL